MDLMLKNVRLSFPDLWEPKEYTPGDGKPRWNASFLIVPGDANDKLIRAAIKEEAALAWKDKAATKLKQFENDSRAYAYQDGNTKEYDGYADHWVLACHRPQKTKRGIQKRPLLLDADTSVLTQDDGKLYAGCYVNAKVSIYISEAPFPGVRASFSAVQFYKDGDAFSAVSAAANEFENVAEGSDASDFA